MILPEGPIRVWLAMRPVDIRKQHDGLSAVVQTVLGRDPYSGAVFAFRSKRGDRMKILVWEGTDGQFAVDGGDDDRVPARRARAVHDKGIAGKDPRLGHAVALDGDEERCRGPLDEMLIQAEACRGCDDLEHPASPVSPAMRDASGERPQAAGRRKPALRLAVRKLRRRERSILRAQLSSGSASRRVSMAVMKASSKFGSS